MTLFYKLFHLDPDSREDVITATSGLGLAANILIALVKILIGTMAASMAIINEGINNAADAATSILTLAGAKLAKKHPDEKHPFGYGRIEYLAGLVIAVLIIVTGVEALIESIRLIIHPEPLQISYLSLWIVAISAVIKFFLGSYMLRTGKRVGSGALAGVGLENRNDSFASIITLASSALFLIRDVSVDAYAGVLIALIILKAGIEVLRETISEILGRPGDGELAKALYHEIRQTDGIVNAADLMLHNYGPDAWSGSVNVEIDHSKTIGEAYSVLHALQLRIMHEYKVTMVFGIYAVDNDDPGSKELRRKLSEFVQQQKHVKSFHAVYLEPETGKLYCDLTVDYHLKDWDCLRKEFLEFVEKEYPGCPVELTIETDFV